MKSERCKQALSTLVCEGECEALKTFSATQLVSGLLFECAGRGLTETRTLQYKDVNNIQGSVKSSPGHVKAIMLFVEIANRFYQVRFTI